MIFLFFGAFMSMQDPLVPKDWAGEALMRAAVAVFDAVLVDCAVADLSTADWTSVWYCFKFH